jgi:hypothetical protein
MPVPDQVAFGKLPKKSDPRTLSLPALLAGEVTFRAEVDNEKSLRGRPWHELGNDTLQDCTIAAAGHAEMLWAAKHDERAKNPTLKEIIDAYSKITGYKPGDETTDTGADLLSVLKYWQQTGIAGQKIGAFAEILPADINTLRWAIDQLDLAYVGLQLPVAWKAPARDDPKPGFTTIRKWRDPATWQNPLYGHCVIYTGYSGDDGFTCVSWGRVMTVSMAFHKAYCDEAYGIIAPKLVDGTATAPHLDQPALKRALVQVKTWPGRDEPG